MLAQQQQFRHGRQTGPGVQRLHAPACALLLLRQLQALGQGLGHQLQLSCHAWLGAGGQGSTQAQGRGAQLSEQIVLRPLLLRPHGPSCRLPLAWQQVAAPGALLSQRALLPQQALRLQPHGGACGLALLLRGLQWGEGWWLEGLQLQGPQEHVFHGP